MQTRFMSVVETAAGTLFGLITGWLTNIIVLPWFGFNVNHGQAVAITIIFTLVSIVRSYGVRRFFNWLHSHGYGNVPKPINPE